MKPPIDIKGRLGEIERELRQGHAKQPEGMLKELMRNMRRDALAEWKTTLDEVINRFQPKRKQALHRFLDGQISRSQTVEVREPKVVSPLAGDPLAVTIDHEAEFRKELAELSQKHIFQWATSYQECLFRHFDRYLETDVPPTVVVRRCLAEHSEEIFTKGYGHQRDAKEATHFTAVEKSIGGLVRFLDLPLEYYSNRTSITHRRRAVRALRELFSAACLGILEGYAAVRFGRERGDSLLPKFAARWGHNLAFLTSISAMDVMDLVEAGPLTEGIAHTVTPLLASIERLIDQPRQDYLPLPLSGRFSQKDGFLQIGLRAPSTASGSLMEARAYLDAEYVFSEALSEAHARNIILVVAPLKPHVRAYMLQRQALSDMVVEADVADSGSVAHRAEQVWKRTILSLQSKHPVGVISYNIARDFPLNRPNPMPFYRVQRTSVHDLLRTFSRTNGVRLWCSVRRSGKTTACFGLDDTAGDSVIVAQTCGTGPTDNAKLFYERVRAAESSGSHLRPNFVEEVVAECLPVANGARRKVLIVDEYETLFEFLRTAAEHNRYVRYTVVQPLLNQLVEFAHDNLLVLLGQQPDAHYILMDQNQLAPYVRQDPFPLFELDRGTRAGEFGKLVAKVLTEHIEFDPSFLAALHSETAGHPYLTVNVLCAFVDWLIDNRHPNLKLDAGDFIGFRNTRLERRQMALGNDYNFFREAIAEAMSERGYKHNRWLYTVYWVLRQIGEVDPSGLSIPRNILPGLMKRIPAPRPLPDPWEILRTATQANFLRHDEEEISVKIPTLGRLASAVRPGLA